MRTFASGVLEALQAASGQERTFLLKFDFSGGPVYFSTGSRDLDWDGQTWTAIGGGLTVGGIEESGDLKGQGVDIILSGADTAIVAVLLGQKFRGRGLRIWQSILNQTTGVVVDSIELFNGLQLDNYIVEERIVRGQPLTATIRTRGRHRLSTKEFRGIRANLHSHQQHYNGDTFYAHTASLATRKVYWGTDAPLNFGSSGGGIMPSDPETEGTGVVRAT